MTDQKLTIQTTAVVAHLRHIARVQHAFAHDGDRKPTPEWLAADLIERQSAQIERMRAALVAARNVVAVDRESFVQCNTCPDQPLDIDDQGIVDEYDALLRMIDGAMEETHESR